MKHIYFLGMVTAIILASLCQDIYGATASQDFRIVVYIPAVPGINAPMENMSEETVDNAPIKAQFNVFTEEIQEDGHTVIRKTIVAK